MFWAAVAGLILVLILSLILAVTAGTVPISAREVYGQILYQISGIRLKGLDSLGTGSIFDIVWTIRLPRVLMGCVVGMSLALSGVIMQATVQNPLADPYILGLSSGASLGATFSIMIGASAVFSGFLQGRALHSGAFWDLFWYPLPFFFCPV